MQNLDLMSDRMGPYAGYRWAQILFAERDYRGAAEALEKVLAEEEGAEHGMATSEVRLLLARSYYHSAQLNAAEREARLLLARQPSDGYAALLLGRTLQRAGRRDDAAGYLAQAAAMGHAE